MRGSSHALVGMAAASGVAIVAGHGLAIPALALGALGGLLPDIDHPYSALGRFVPWPSVEVLGRGKFVRTGRKWLDGHTIWHRGETHSVGAAVIAALLVGGLGVLIAPTLAAWGLGMGAHPFVLGVIFAVSMLLGYASHLVADLINPSPQMWAWPLSSAMKRPRGLPAVRSGSIRGWLVETGIVTCLMAGVWAEVGRHLL